MRVRRERKGKISKGKEGDGKEGILRFFLEYKIDKEKEIEFMMYFLHFYPSLNQEYLKYLIILGFLKELIILLVKNTCFIF